MEPAPCSRPPLHTLLRWLPAVLWKGTIFTASGDVMSHGSTSRYFYPFFQWLIPGISEGALHTLHFLFRKGGHIAEYTLLASLIWYGVGSWRSGWGKVRLVWLLTVLYAASDEFRQSFVPSRQGALADVALDAVGASLGIFIMIAAPRLWRRFRRKR